MALPAVAESGELPPGVHRATLREVLERLGRATPRRKVIALRLERIYQLASATGHLGCCVVFGSFVTGQSEPNDVDVFLLVADTFDVSRLTGEARLLFDHAADQAHFGGRVFWLQRLAALGGEEETIRYRQIQRDGHQRWDCRDYSGGAMIADDQELEVSLGRIARLQAQAAHLRKMETNPTNYHASVSGFLVEIDRMQLEVREYLSLHPEELRATA